jgi:hypothetical protein
VDQYRRRWGGPVVPAYLDQAVEAIERDPLLAREGPLERQLRRREAETLIKNPGPKDKHEKAEAK